MTRRGVVIPGSDDDFEAARRVFAARHCLTLEGFVDSDLLAAAPVTALPADAIAATTASVRSCA